MKSHTEYESLFGSYSLAKILLEMRIQQAMLVRPPLRNVVMHTGQLSPKKLRRKRERRNG